MLPFGVGTVAAFVVSAAVNAKILSSSPLANAQLMGCNVASWPVTGISSLDSEASVNACHHLLWYCGTWEKAAI